MDKKKLMERYQKLYEEARALNVDDLDTFTIPADADEITIAELGKILRTAVNAAKAF
jgi:hypothetical protein